MSLPLAEKLRPTCLNEVFGQDHLLTEGGILKASIKKGMPLSLLLWGPPGSGKTTLARIYAKSFSAAFYPLSGVSSGVAEIKKLIATIENTPLHHQKTVIFLDEIHRFNKAQQDLFLPYLEKGTFTLIGATTENPSFTINNALLSRMRVLELNSLSSQDLNRMLERYEKEKGSLPLTEEGKKELIQLACGDGRYLMNLIENLEYVKGEKKLSLEELSDLLQKKKALYDQKGEGHYNLISALHKSVRGSDPDAALYWFCRMLEGGEDPLFIARRLIRMANEDIGLADPQALVQAMHAREAYHLLGSPEGELALAQAVIYLALAPKSNRLYLAYKKGKEFAAKTGNLTPPKTILNAPTKLMKEKEYGKGYQYDHDTQHGFSGQHYFPDEVEREIFYEPVERGFERQMGERLAYFKKLRLHLQND